MSARLLRACAVAVGLVGTALIAPTAHASGPMSADTFLVCGRGTPVGGSHCIGLQAAIDKATTMPTNITVKMMPGTYCPPKFPAPSSIYWYSMNFVGVGLAAYANGGSFSGPEASLTTFSWDSACGGSAPIALIEMANAGANTGAISLRNLTVDGSGGGLAGVFMSNASVGLRDVIVQHFSYAGVEADSTNTAYHSNITSSSIVHNPGIGVSFGGTSTGSIDQSTVADNGTGVTGGAPVSLLNDTIAHNGTGFSSSSTSQVYRTINADNTTADCTGSGWESGTTNGYNDAGSTCASQHATDDILATGTVAPLADNGGPTPSITPPTAAVGKGGNGGCSSSTTVGNPIDQREYLITSSVCDIGSVALSHSSHTPSIDTYPSGTTDLGQGSADSPAGQLVTVSSTGGSLVYLYDVSISGAGFSLTYDGCSLEVMLPVPTQYCQLGVQGVPSAAHPTITGYVTVRTSAGVKHLTFAAHGLDASSLRAAAGATIGYGRVRTLTTTLTDTTTLNAVRSAKVVLQARAAGQSTYIDVATRTTSSTGGASVTVKPKASTTYRWYYAGSSTVYPATSPAAVVHVAQLVTARLARTSVPTHKTVTVTGTVSPKENGLKVTLQYRSGASWVAHGTAVVHGAAYTLHTTFAAKGTRVLRIVRAATSANAAGTSPTLTLHTT